MLYFSGNDFVRSGAESSMSGGRFKDGAYYGLSSGLWSEGNSLPQDEYEYSPTLLFSKFNNKIVIAGHFTHQ